MKVKIVDGEARDRLIIWIRRRMEEFGITAEALEASIQHDEDHPPLYRDARGNEWNGLGDAPDWIQAATNAGLNPDFFRVEPKPASSVPVKGKPENEAGKDSRQLDLFFDFAGQKKARL